ncbi:MAG TPA: helix-turn-helix domain-containing protein [Solirubrobacteraceae bacterium]|nr:helix-turn-helix domain-containing protein [Solirubrobacteraceae bacterium]
MEAANAHQQARGLQRVGEALAARNEQLADEMVRRIRDEVPTYSRVDPAVLERVRVLSTATALAISTALIDHTPVRRNDVPIIAEHAADRLRSGIDLESFLHAYRAALFFYWDTAIEEASRLRLSRAASRALGRFVLDSVDTITTHAAEAYLREDSHVSAQSGRAVRDLVDSLIAGRPVSVRGTRHPAAPGLDPERAMQLIVARVTDSSHDLDTALTIARDVLGDNLALGATRPLSSIRHQEVVVLTAGSPPISRLHSAARSAREHHATQVGIGVSNSPDGFAGIPRAYAEAALTLSYTSRHRPVVALPELRALQLLLLGSTDATRQLISEKGAALFRLSITEQQSAIDTITAFVAASMSVATAASLLHVHPNTVRYRLKRIAEITGCDPTSFSGLADLHCIIELATAETQPARIGGVFA